MVLFQFKAAGLVQVFDLLTTPTFYRVSRRRPSNPGQENSIATAPRGGVAAITVFVDKLFARSNCASGASVCTSAAVQAGVGIDLVDVALADCVGGTY